MELDGRQVNAGNKYNIIELTLSHDLLFEAQCRSDKSHHAFPQLVIAPVSMLHMYPLRHTLRRCCRTHIVKSRCAFRQTILCAVDVIIQDICRR